MATGEGGSLDALIEQVHQLKWVHRIDLGHGVVTPGLWGNHPIILRAFDDIDFRGKKVLDIGCWDGLWSFEAEKRGAAEVHATDLVSQRDYQDCPTFQLAHKILRSRVKYHPNLSVYDVEKLGVRDFDVVICAGVYYHLKDPLRSFAALRRVMKDGGILLVEGEVLEEEGCFARFFYREPYMGDHSNWWIPTVSCLKQWVESNFFEEVRAFDVWYARGGNLSPRSTILARSVRRADPLYIRPDEALREYDLNEYREGDSVLSGRSGRLDSPFSFSALSKDSDLQVRPVSSRNPDLPSVGRRTRHHLNLMSLWRSIRDPRQPRQPGSSPAAPAAAATTPSRHDPRLVPEPSFSQCGEDRIAELVFRLAGVSDRVSYLDVGAANPVGDNNTFLSYLRGGSGVLVEADPKYVPAYAELRPRDRVENVALVPKRLMASGSVDFFLAEDPGWSSISREHLATAERLGKGGVRQTISVPSATIDQVLDRHFQGRELHLLSMDIEGMDSEVLREIEFQKYRPWVIVVENDGGLPVHKDFMNDVGYRFYGFTTVNSIYVEGSILGALRF